MKLPTHYLRNNSFRKTSLSISMKNTTLNKNFSNSQQKYCSTIQSISPYIYEPSWTKAKSIKQYVKNSWEIISVTLFLLNKSLWLKSENQNGKLITIFKSMLSKKINKSTQSINMTSSELALDLSWDPTIHSRNFYPNYRPIHI